MFNALSDFLIYCRVERRLADLTCTAYERDVRTCLEFLGERGIRDLDRIGPPDLRAFLAAEATHRPAVSSQARAVATLKCFFRFCAESAHIESNPAHVLRTPKKREALPDVLDRAELAIRVARTCTGEDVLDVISGLIAKRGAPTYLRADNGPELVAWTLRDYCRMTLMRTSYVEPGSPWENPFVESFNGRLRDELLNIEEFGSIAEARVIIEDWRTEYNTYRPTQPSADSHPPNTRREEERTAKTNRSRIGPGLNASARHPSRRMVLAWKCSSCSRMGKGEHLAGHAP